jgi:hypothetical protein
MIHAQCTGGKRHDDCEPRKALYISRLGPRFIALQGFNFTDEGPMRIAVLIGAAIVCFLLIATQSAYACPAGTVFSAYNGNGICAYVGQGATKAVQCTKMVNSCPPNTTHEHKKSDPNDYCCPMDIANPQPMKCVWRGTPPLCEGHCGALEQSKGTAADYDHAYFNRNTKTWAGTFGKSCASGSKELCCHPIGLN